MAETRGGWIDRVDEAAEAIAYRSPLRPQFAIVLGSGLGALADAVEDAVVVPYHEIPGFPRSTAPSHAGRLIMGRFEGKPVMMFSGRAHLYEGYTPNDVVFGVRLASRLGAEALIVTNAAGGIRTDKEPGSLMVISDHINLTGSNPLVGPNDQRTGVRFPDMTNAYDPAMRHLAFQLAAGSGTRVFEGVYLGLLGPSYETPAEIRMARALGADAVGMSTVLEVIAARHLGLRVLGISCITNLAAGLGAGELSEEEVIATADRVREEFAQLVRGVVAAYSTEVREDRIENT